MCSFQEMELSRVMDSSMEDQCLFSARCVGVGVRMCVGVRTQVNKRGGTGVGVNTLLIPLKD